MSLMNDVVSPLTIAKALSELWSPRVVAELDDSYVKVAKVKGTLGWHTHDEEDEMFFVLSGEFRIEMRGGAVDLQAGEVFVVPKGVEHNPVAVEECCIMLIEKKTTAHTGTQATPFTRSVEEQLRSL